jgi:ParB family chromosome partitioning protein
MATPKKGQGIAFRLPGNEERAEGSMAADQVVATSNQMEPRRSVPKTGLGLLSRVIADAHGDSEEVTRLNEEVARLKLQAGEQLIDPRLIRSSKWADRHPDSFTNEAFRELRQEIEAAGGNVQAVKVRPIPGAPTDDTEPRFELIFGSRRTRACLDLGLPVRAVVEEGINDQDLYVQMQRENRNRASLSAWEQGVSYHKALQEGLFPSARRLAEAIGVDPSNLAKALRIASLPEEIVGAFASPCDIQFRWTGALEKVLHERPEQVLAVARALRTAPGARKAAEVFKALTQVAPGMGASAAVPDARPAEPSVTVEQGGVTLIEIPKGVIDPQRAGEFEKALRDLIGQFSLKS